MKRENPRDAIPTPKSDLKPHRKNSEHVTRINIVPKGVSQATGSRMYPSTYDSAQPVISVYIDGMSFTMLEHLRGIWECSRSEAVCRILRPISKVFLNAMKDEDATGFIVSKRWSFDEKDWEDWRRRCLL